MLPATPTFTQPVNPVWVVAVSTSHRVVTICCCGVKAGTLFFTFLSCLCTVEFCMNSDPYVYSTPVYSLPATWYVSDYLSHCVACQAMRSADGVPFDGRPFCVVGRRQLECRFGPMCRKKIRPKEGVAAYGLN